MTVDELLSVISKGLKNPIVSEDIFSEEINVSHLKRIDKVFNKGLHYYLDPKSPEVSNDASIFFRKDSFEVDLNLGAKKIVNQFEEFKISLSAIAKLADLSLPRSIPEYHVQHDPKAVAQSLRKLLYPDFVKDKKEFLKLLIAKFAERNILVFEFVETWNKKEKANIDGFFLNPNVIVLKRHQKSFRREIFTLIHELGHYLLNEEEVDELDVKDLANSDSSIVERWCNDFTYYFLVGEFDKYMNSIERVDGTNDYHFELIEYISNNTHLSQIALFTRLLLQKKLSPHNYNIIKADFDKRYAERQEEEKLNKELLKESGIKQRGSVPKPINSPLLVSTIQTAFYEGIISEYEVCRTLNIKPNNLHRFIQ